MKLAILLTALAQPVLAQGAPPASFAVADRSVVLTVHAQGAQIYECQAKAGAPPAWTFREPIAALMSEGRTVGRHFAGPTWEFTNGDTVKGKQVASAPGATLGDVALLKLDVMDHPIAGALRDVAIVLRLNTHGGGLSGACTTPGEFRPVPYSADYQFLR